LFLILIFGLPRETRATSCATLSEVDFASKTYCKTMVVEESVAIPRTAVDFSVANVVNVPSNVLFNSNPDQFGTCGAYHIGNKLNEDEQLDQYLAILEEGGGALISGQTIEDSMVEGETIGCNFNDSLYGSRITGSLMGLTRYAYVTIPNEPVPVNLASYFKYNLRKLPVVGNTAYAQEYNMWGQELALDLWTKTRNIAYAMMAVIMLVVGILIITRKRINPQTVVTVQTAMPRIVISLLLITFSYPIGAVFASSVVPLSVLVMGVFFADMVDSAGTIADMNHFSMVNTLIAVTLGGEGIVALLTMMLLAAATLIVMLVVIVKIILINLKILLAIVFAPIQFAISAIPGQEEQISKWFKQMIARVLAIPAMLFMVGLAWYILIAPFDSPEDLANIIAIGREPVATIGLSFFRRYAVSRVLTLIMLPLMCLFTMFTALKADKAIEGWIMGSGDRKPRGKK